VLLFGALLIASCRTLQADHTASEFYRIRRQLMLINPYEMVFMLSAPAVILWSVLCRKGLFHYLHLGVVYVAVLYPTLIAAMSLHWDLISQWKAGAEQHPAIFDEMLRGDGPKMIMLVLVGWVYVAAKYLFWLLVISPAAYLSGRKRGRAQPCAGDMSFNEGWLTLQTLRVVPGIVAEVFLVLGILAALAAGPCFWEKLQSDAPPLAQPMFPMFFIVGASFAAVGLLIRRVERTWISKLRRVPVPENE
jgi:hypothetical protein